jgi:hypothetical protein
MRSCTRFLSSSVNRVHKVSALRLGRLVLWLLRFWIAQFIQRGSSFLGGTLGGQQGQHLLLHAFGLFTEVRIFRGQLE